MIVCPLCGTTDKNKFVGSLLLTDLQEKFVRNIVLKSFVKVIVQCGYCSDNFYVETDLNWKTSKDVDKIANPKYTVIATTWYKDDNGVEQMLIPKCVITLQGFELSTHSDYSPFKTVNGDIVRIHNKRVKRI